MVFLLTLSWDLTGGWKINLGRPVTQCWHFYVFLHNFEYTMKNNKWQKLKCPWQTNKQNSTLWYFYLCFPLPHTVFTPTELEILTQHVNLFLPELPWPLHLTSLLEVLQTKWLAPSLALLIRHITSLLFFLSLNVIGICEAFERHVWDYILCSWLSTASCFKCVVLQRIAFESLEHECLAHTRFLSKGNKGMWVWPVPYKGTRVTHEPPCIHLYFHTIRSVMRALRALDGEWVSLYKLSYKCFALWCSSSWTLVRR